MKESFKTGDLLRFENRQSSQGLSPMVCMGTIEPLAFGDELVRVMFPNGQIAAYYASNLRKL
jgi:hypothetical protein